MQHSATEILYFRQTSVKADCSVHSLFQCLTHRWW